MNIIAGVPILILIILLFAFGSSALMRTGIRSRKMWVGPVMAVYGALLLFALPAYHLLPHLYSVPEVGAERTSYWESQQRVQAFYDAVEADALETMDGVRRVDTWTFVYEGGPLRFADAEGLPIALSVVVRYKDTEDGIIEAAFYTTANYIDGYDYAHFIKAPDLTLKDNRIIIMRPERYEVNLYRFIQDFTIRQFRRSPRVEQGSRSIHGPQLLLIRLPQGAQIIPNPGVHVID